MTAIQAPRATRLLDEKAAAALIGVQPRTLSVWRITGRYGLGFIKVGRSVRYSEEVILAWLHSRTRSTGATA